MPVTSTSALGIPVLLSRPQADVGVSCFSVCHRCVLLVLCVCGVCCFCGVVQFPFSLLNDLVWFGLPVGVRFLGLECGCAQLCVLLLLACVWCVHAGTEGSVLVARYARLVSTSPRVVLFPAPPRRLALRACRDWLLAFPCLSVMSRVRILVTSQPSRVLLCSPPHRGGPLSFAFGVFQLVAVVCASCSRLNGTPSPCSVCFSSCAPPCLQSK